MKRGFTVWFTGVPDAGKTTLSRLLAKVLGQKGFDVELLDGNELREGLKPQVLGFPGRSARTTTAGWAIWLACSTATKW